jgi:hypothetical protein
MYHNSIIFQNNNTIFINTDFLAKFPEGTDSLERMVYPEVFFSGKDRTYFLNGG